MPITDVNSYLFFDGTAEQAVRLYERALGAKLEGLMRYGEIPGDAAGCKPEDSQRVIHAALRVGSSLVLISDTASEMPKPEGANVNVCLQYDDVDEMKRAFEALAEGGTVGMALHDTFWNATFGTLTDAFGIRWMLNCPKAGA